ncbi:MAG: aminopeptidase [Bdellovibrionales bacterium]|nr:aminopeptidase [Bdellovibrionales bacterium]
MTFDEKLRNYAELLVAHGLNVQSGQVVNISSEAIHRDFSYAVAEAAYARGAKHVNIDLMEPRLARLRIEKSSEEDLAYVPKYLSVKYRDLVDQTAANIKIIGSENPDILADLDPKRVNTVRLNQHLAVKYFYDEGIGKSKVHWTVAAAATPRWGQKVFPKLGAEEACAKLWDEIFRICRADKPNCLELWREHNDTLQARAKKLTDLKIKQLHFTGPGTDLYVGLSQKAKFKGGGDMSPRKVEFEPNVPTEEVFTTPDCRETHGKVRATRPFLINGKLITDLELEFNAGKISSFSASEGEETFREYIRSDENADRLGEVALVGIDSPVFQSGLVFQEILFDENAACHIAVGSAYKFCLEGGDSMSKEELEAVGCNDSTVHTDMMISSEEVNVSAQTYNGEQIALIENGKWAAL